MLTEKLHDLRRSVEASRECLAIAVAIRTRPIVPKVRDVVVLHHTINAVAIPRVVRDHIGISAQLFHHGIARLATILDSPRIHERLDGNGGPTVRALRASEVADGSVDPAVELHQWYLCARRIACR